MDTQPENGPQVLPQSNVPDSNLTHTSTTAGKELRRALGEMALDELAHDQAAGDDVTLSELDVRERLAALSDANIVLRAQILERQRVETALRQSEQRLRAVLDAAPLVLWAIDRNGIFTLSEGEGLHSLGLKPGEVVGQSVWELYAAFPDILDSVRRALDGESVVMDVEVGALVFESHYLPLRGPDGAVEGMTGVSTDITARRQSERGMQARARQQEAVAMLGQQALLGLELDALVNKAVHMVAATLNVEFTTILELRPAIGKPDGGKPEARNLVMWAGVGWSRGLGGEYQTPADGDSPGAYVLRCDGPVIIEDVETESRFRIPPIMREHGIRSGMSVPICSPDGPLGVMGAHTTKLRAFTHDDVNFFQAIANVLAAAIARKRSEAALRAAREEAERANDAKSEFLSRMSHELRTPLNAILGFGQLLEADDLSPDQNESVDHIVTAGRHLLKLINEVLDITRVESGHLALSPETVSLDAVIEEALHLVRPLAAQHGIELAPVPHCRLFVLADFQRLQQVLLNLLSNAVKYNRPGGTVRLECFLSDGRVRLEVRDSGPGIAPGDLKKLFVPFERLDAARSSIEGTGLGLSLSRVLSEAMSGTLEASSVRGQGTTFCLELPSAPAPIGVRAPGEAAPPEKAAEVPVARRKVLSIEDNASNFRLIEKILARRPGVELLGAMQGSLGLELARDHHPDLILLDLHLPDISGADVLARLREDPATREIPVVVVSADATEPQIERLLAAGARAYLTKPLDVPHFLRVLDEALDS